MATFFRPSPPILATSASIKPDLSSKRVEALRSARPAHLSMRSSDPSCLDHNVASADAAIGARPESRIRGAAGCFTEEKAKQLRRKTADGYIFHDVMYHSAIASRLATDLSFHLRFE